MSFTFLGNEFKYFDHEYNRTTVNERRMEVPIGKYYMDKYKELRRLELGNVLSHYFPTDWDIVDIDPSEIGGHVIHEDITTFKPETKYDFFLSISTLEHVANGQNAMKNVRENCLNDKAKVLVTIPWGYFKALDNVFVDGLGFDKVYYMQRNKNNEWREVEYKDILDTGYEFPYDAGNSILFGTNNL